MNEIRLRDISLTVYGFELKNSVVLYKIEVCKGTDKFAIEKRFSNILQELHETVGKYYGVDPPSKKVMESFGLTMQSTDEFYQSRMTDLQNYFNVILSMPGIDKNEKFNQFFEIKVPLP